MALNKTTFEYLNPTQTQQSNMSVLRRAAADYAAIIQSIVPDGPDKTYALRKLREVAMWTNVALTRHPDGTPRKDDEHEPIDYPPNHPAPGDLGSVPL